MSLKVAVFTLLARRFGLGLRSGVLAMAFAFWGASSLSAQELVCPFPQQKPMLVTQLFFGRNVPHRGSVTANEWRRFLRDYVTPAFPDGFTVYDAYGQWLNPKTHSIGRDPTKVVVIATADSAEVRTKVAEVSENYRRLFHQESVGVISVTECGAF
jgi:hypothetical protein